MYIINPIVFHDIVYGFHNIVLCDSIIGINKFNLLRLIVSRKEEDH